MSPGPLSRLAGFAVALVAVFAVAALAGGAVDTGRPVAKAPAEEAAHGADPHGGGAEAPAPVRGLAVAEGGLRLEIQARDPLAFRITRDGRPVKDFDVEHEKRMHLIVVRRDGRGFRHLHPVMNAEGTWTEAAQLNRPGAYRVFADFVHDERAYTLAADVLIPGETDYDDRFPAPAETFRTAGGYDVQLEARGGELEFTVSRGGRPVETEPYLGAGGHLVALREGDLAFLHTHPADHGATAFETNFPSAGRYRLYFQFKADGRVETAEFTREVTR